MKVYTIIANFGLTDYGKLDQLWVANYKNKEDAIKVFRSKLGDTGALKYDGTVYLNEEFTDNTDEVLTVEQLFDCLLTNGTRYVFGLGSEMNIWFIRGEELQENFNEEIISWE